MKKARKIIAILLLVILAFTVSACTNDNGGIIGGETLAEKQNKVDASLGKLSDEDFTYAQLSGVDALGRATTPVSELQQKYVGLFYFVATGYIDENGKGNDKIFDISNLLEKYGNNKLTNPVMALTTGATRDYYDPAISPEGQAHFWAEPLYGYYRSDDPWVVRKHLELFINAGIDFLYLDYTNNLIYEEATKVLLDAILQMQAEGYNPPKVVFMMTYNSGNCSSTWLSHVKPTYFSDDKYADCWFRADETLNPSGNPLIIGNFTTMGESDPIFKNMWVKNIQWPSDGFDAESIPWMDWSVTQKNHNGVMCVTVSQGGASSSEAYFDKNTSYEARGWSPNNPLEHGVDEANVLSGTNFEFKWSNAISSRDELNMVTVTGWNEWIVRKLADNDPAAHHYGYGEYVDCFDMAYSRDAEMMKGGYGDNYYMQLARNIRSFKGNVVDGIANVASNVKASINLTDLSSWDSVTRKYLDLGASTVARNHTAVDRAVPYVDKSNRNDIAYLKMASDDKNLYVAVTAKTDITDYEIGDLSWMNLYISTGNSGGWENYNYVINRTPDMAAKKTSVEKFTGNNSQVSRIASADIYVSGETIVYAIALSDLGVINGKDIQIKATDHLKKFGSCDDFYTTGDSAPMGRMNYVYKIA